MNIPTDLSTAGGSDRAAFIARIHELKGALKRQTSNCASMLHVGSFGIHDQRLQSQLEDDREILNKRDPFKE